MSANLTSSIVQSTETTRDAVLTSSVISKDGTTIGYRQIGSGPGVIVIHGAMETSQSHLELAGALAHAHTVYALERRGRGLSGPFGKDYSLQKEVDDVEALIARTGARFVFGVSAGAVIVLVSALRLPGIQKAAIFEPALPINGSLSTAFLPRYDREIAQGKVSAALVTGMKGARMGPPVFNMLPRWLLELLTTTMLASEDKKAKSGDVTFRMLAPTLHYDFQLALESEKEVDSFKQIKAEMLLLGGSESPAYLKAALDAMGKVFPHARRVVYPGLNHGASGNANRGGKPELVAQDLLTFFA